MRTPVRTLKYEPPSASAYQVSPSTQGGAVSTIAWMSVGKVENGWMEALASAVASVGGPGGAEGEASGGVGGSEGLAVGGQEVRRARPPFAKSDEVEIVL